MKKLVVGILAHVDAGKTTLSEGLLYISGRIRKLGRVDNKDAYLDSYELERARGITIFSKQAVFDVNNIQITLLDTPGHVDFSAEMERTLQILDYAILVISGSDGVQGHTQTLWRLLSVYDIPVFIFINKMDQNGTDKEKLMEQLKIQLDDGCIEFGQGEPEEFKDQLAMCDEELMEAYLDKGRIEVGLIKKAIASRKVYPCFFGSALRLEGVEELMQGIRLYSNLPSYPEKFGAKIFKISRDEQGNRLTHMRITGGRLKVRDALSNGVWEEKINQIRIYSGHKFEAVNVAEAGVVCAVTGLTQTKPGEGLGAEMTSDAPVLEPVLSYQIILPQGYDPKAMLPSLRQIEEEEPELRIVWDEQLREIRVQIMGEVQLEILQSLIQSRFDIDVAFGSGRIIYKETIANTVEGGGHFEPLRHYAEVHLLMEPGERGSGLCYAVDCSDDVLGKSYKNLILTHLQEKVHKGVLTGYPITDMKITLVSGRAHNKHTEGGDFREATYRAVRQGLMESESILLEPYYSFRLELPEQSVGRAISDIDKMHGVCQVSQIKGVIAVLEGEAPVSAMGNYQKDVTAYTKGDGRLFCSLIGYGVCHNSEDVIEAIGYDSDRDLANPTGSVFCENGASFLVSWNEVKSHMHIEGYLSKESSLAGEARAKKSAGKDADRDDNWIDQEEVDRIFKQTYYANKGRKIIWKKPRTATGSYHASPNSYVVKARQVKQEYLLVDGYNIVFAWVELKELVEENMDGAREKLIDYMSKYQHFRKCRIIIVFDAYRVQGHDEEMIDYGNVYVVYTKEAQSADHFIEKFAHSNKGRYNITVATSDGLQQIIIRGAGCAILSARELREEVISADRQIMEVYRQKQQSGRNYLSDALSSETKKRINRIIDT